MPARETNPLAPRYSYSPEPTSPTKLSLPYPTAAVEPGEWRKTSPVRRAALDSTDIAGTSPSTALRTRRVRACLCPLLSSREDEN